MSLWSSCQGPPLGVDCYMFVTCKGLYMSSRELASCIVFIPGACIWLHLNDNQQLQHCSEAGDSGTNSTVSGPSSCLTQKRLTGLGTCGCCWRIHLQMPTRVVSVDCVHEDICPLNIGDVQADFLTGDM